MKSYLFPFLRPESDGELAKLYVFVKDTMLNIHCHPIREYEVFLEMAEKWYGIIVCPTVYHKMNLYSVLQEMTLIYVMHTLPSAWYCGWLPTMTFMINR